MSEIDSLDLKECIIAINLFSQLHIAAPDWLYYSLTQTGQASTKKSKATSEMAQISLREAKHNFYTFLSFFISQVLKNHALSM